MRNFEKRIGFQMKESRTLRAEDEIRIDKKLKLKQFNLLATSPSQVGHKPRVLFASTETESCLCL